MKFYNIGKFALLLGCVILTACDDDDDNEYALANIENNDGVSFAYDSPTLSDDYSDVDDPVSVVTLNLTRKDATKASVVPIEVISNDSLNGVPVFTVPATVSFAAGASEASIEVSYLTEKGGTYSVILQVAEEYRNTYANNMLQYSVTLPYPWLSYSATYTDYFMGVQAPVTVQNIEGTNTWRVVRPFASLFESDDEYDYSIYAQYINFEVLSSGYVKFTTFNCDIYSEGYPIYGFYPSSLASSVAAYDALSKVLDEHTIILCPYFYVPGLGGFGCDYPLYIELDEDSEGSFGTVFPADDEE